MTTYKEIQIIDWYSENKISDEDGDETRQKKLYIYLYGKDIQGNDIKVSVVNFPCYFYLSIPKQWINNGKLKKYRIDTFIDNLIKRLRPDDRVCLIKSGKKCYEIVKRKKFRGFTNQKKLPFIRLLFSNSQSMKNCINIFIKKRTYSGSILNIRKYNGLSFISTDSLQGLTNDSIINICQNKYPIIRKDILNNEIIVKGIVELPDNYDKIRWVLVKTDLNSEIKLPYPFISGLFNRDELVELYESNIEPLLRFIHIKKVNASGWIQIPNNGTGDYEIDWKLVEPINRPNISKKTLAFDIECTSSHGDFPLPIKNYLKLAKDYINLSNDSLKNITNILTHIHLKNVKSVNRIYIKNNQSWIDTESIDRLSMIIYQYLWFNKATKQCIKKGVYSIKTDEIISQLYLEKSLFTLELLNNLAFSIPNLEFKYKSSFCDLEKHEDIIQLIYSVKEDPNLYTEQALNVLFTDNLPKVEGDRCIQIGACLSRQGESDAYHQIIYTLGSCDDFSDSVVVKAYPDTLKGESQMLLDFKKLIMTENPDIITGYNIFNFDWPYLFDRAQELDILDDFCELSRLHDFKCKVISTNSKKAKGKFLEIPGRVHLDLYKTIQADHNLGSYKLDAVANNFIRGHIKAISILENKNIKVNVDNTIGLKKGNFIQAFIEKGYDNNKVMNGKKFLIESVGIDYFTITDTIIIPEKDILSNSVYWCLGKDDIKPEDIFKCQKGTSKDRSIIAKYCVMDVILCIELLNKLNIINNNIAMSNVCSVPLSWIFRRGQGIKILSLVAKQCRIDNYLLPTLFPDNYINDDTYEGAVVLKPNPGIYLDDEPIVVLDYASLYPSSMLSNNLSHESIVTDAKWLGINGGKRLTDLGYTFVDISYDNFKYINGKKVKTGIVTDRFAQFGEKKGIIPTILDHLLTARKKTRSKIKHKKFTLNNQNIIYGLIKNEDLTHLSISTDNNDLVKISIDDIVKREDRYSDFEKELFDCDQQAYKITANSLYGQIGAKTSPIYYKSIAASTTATGREQLEIAKDFIEKHYDGSKIIYGDTDSVFVRFNLLENGKKMYGKPALKKAIKLGIEAGKRICKILKKPQDLEYEKTFMPFILISKKRYVGNKYEFNTDKYKQTSMGIVLKRRDNAPILKVIYGGVIDIIMKEMKILPAISYLKSQLRQLISGNFNLEKFIITKTLNDNYKNPEMIAHNVLANRIAKRDPGNKPLLGDRIPYIYVESPETVKLQGDRIEDPNYIIKNKLKIDYLFYITNQILKPISQIFALKLEDIPTFNKGKNYFKQLNTKLLQEGKLESSIEKKIIKERQKLTEDLLFWDILDECDAQRQGRQNILKWCK